MNFRDLSAIDQHHDDSRWMNDITIEDDSCKIQSFLSQCEEIKSVDQSVFEALFKDKDTNSLVISGFEFKDKQTSDKFTLILI